MAAPLYECLRAFQPDVRLFTPGHKGCLGGLFSTIAPFDVTELADTDNLYAPDGAIAQAEKLASLYYKSQYTFFSAGGASLCIQTALSLFTGKCVIMDRNSHISAFRAAATLDINMVFLTNGFLDVPVAVTAEQVKQACILYPNACAVYITSPNYYGLCADLSTIKKICIRYGKILIVDNAHGSHMFVTNQDTCAHRFADIVIDSAHKTLPVLTGGAYLHFYMHIDSTFIKENMRYFGSTSPSYLILLSLDLCREWMQLSATSAFAVSVKQVDQLKQFFAGKGIKVLNAPGQDPMRITLCVNDGNGLASFMQEDGIYCEMCGQNTVVMLFSPFNQDRDFEKVKSFFNKIYYKINYNPLHLSIPETKPLQGRSYRNAFFGTCKKIKISDSIGQVAAKDIMPYPPGVPILLAGEFITRGKVDYLKMFCIEEVFVSI